MKLGGVVRFRLSDNTIWYRYVIMHVEVEAAAENVGTLRGSAYLGV